VPYFLLVKKAPAQFFLSAHLLFVEQQPAAAAVQFFM
jgi:hypothetical protein